MKKDKPRSSGGCLDKSLLNESNHNRSPIVGAKQIANLLHSEPPQTFADKNGCGNANIDELLSSNNPRRYSVLLVSDYFYPNLGGVEMHMFQLGQCLIERGHKVTVMTNTYSKERMGVRYVSNGMKVYHLPLLPFASQDSFASFMFLLCILRKICIRESIDIVHGHQTTALLNIGSLLHGVTLGKKVVFTDHSLFGFSDAASININKVLKWVITNADAAICVSHVNKDNLSLRAAVDPNIIYVIPNAVDTTRF
jgi:phosphatidylinositol glycan class A protein